MQNQRHTERVLLPIVLIITEITALCVHTFHHRYYMPNQHLSPIYPNQPTKVYLNRCPSLTFFPYFFLQLRFVLEQLVQVDVLKDQGGQSRGQRCLGNEASSESQVMRALAHGCRSVRMHQTPNCVIRPSKNICSNALFERLTFPLGRVIGLRHNESS